MLKIVLVAALAVLGIDARFLSRAPQQNGRIVGGVDANIEDYPYHVGFERFRQYVCGGSIIGVYKIVLTAAHCTIHFPATIMRVRYGTSLRDQGGTVIGVSEVFQHPLYDALTKEYDIAVLKLDGIVVFSPQVSPIILVSPDVQEGGRSAWVTGWGRVYSGGPVSDQLQVVEVQEVDRDACSRSYPGRITESMICFIDEDNDACQGDSGGPLVSGNRQIGVVSWARGCADTTRPGVYANIHNRDIVDHIATIITEHDTD